MVSKHWQKKIKINKDIHNLERQLEKLTEGELGEHQVKVRMKAKFDPQKDHNTIDFKTRRGQHNSEKGNTIESETYTVLKKTK